MNPDRWQFKNQANNNFKNGIYTYTSIAKPKQSNKNKVQQVVPVNKRNKKLYLLVKNKTNLSTNWKTKLKQGANFGIKQ